MGWSVLGIITITASENAINITAIDSHFSIWYCSSITTTKHILNTRFTTINCHSRIIASSYRIIVCQVTATIYTFQSIGLSPGFAHLCGCRTINKHLHCALGRTIYIITTKHIPSITASHSYRHGTIDISRSVICFGFVVVTQFS